MRTKVTRSCEMCGSPFQTYPCQVRAGRGRVCSHSCASKLRRRASVEERFWSKVDRSGGDNACWPFVGTRDASGYGHFRVGGILKQAHRVAYELTVGPIPDGFDLHHMNERGCITKSCCNPSHLQPLPEAKHVGHHNSQRRSDHCPHGHAYTLDNLFIGNDGRRRCRACRRERGNRHRMKVRAQ
jgi:hypothetical protein